jgi:Polyketide cyclase / dehydrase and lipid transport
MAIVSRTIRVRPEQVFAVLADGWSYSDWVVGTAHIRSVDPHWPQVGARLHHKIGPWPLSLKDSSTVTACTPDRSLTLDAGLWPLGAATVHIELEPWGADATRVTIHEDFHAGPLAWTKNKINDLALHGRNVEALRRLADLAEQRSEDHQPVPGGTA